MKIIFLICSGFRQKAGQCDFDKNAAVCRRAATACLAVALVFLAGCMTPIGADKVSPRQAYQHLQQNALNSGSCSADTRRVLNRYGLATAFENNPDATLAKLQSIACNDDRRDLLYALAELNYWNADRQSRSVKPGVPKLARNSY